MPSIHHAQTKKAERLGFTLANTEKQPTYVEAFKADYNLRVYGVSAIEAIAQMEAALSVLRQIENEGGRARFLASSDQPRLATFEYGGEIQMKTDTKTVAMTPHEWASALRANNVSALLFDQSPIDTSGDDVTDSTQHLTDISGPYGDPDDNSDHEGEDVRDEPGTQAVIGQEFQEDPNYTRINGVASDGAIAYREGTMTADCPFEEGTDEAEAWYVAWDAAADAATDAEENDDSKGGSVVKSKFRARYAEAGHPTHCGDDLAIYLNNLCVGDKNTDLALFEVICGLNGIDTSKYRREGVGWQGRIRMTGRNMLAKVVYHNGGVLNLPETLGTTHKMSGEWMANAKTKYKAKS